MVEEAHHLNDLQASYQKLIDDSIESEVITKNTKQVIPTAQAVIAKAQALIQVNEQKLAAARKRLEELEAVKKRIQEDLTARSSKLKSLQAQLAMKKFLSEEELRVQAWAEVEKAASARCSASGTGSILWLSGISPPPLVSSFFFCNTPLVK